MSYGSNSNQQPPAWLTQIYQRMQITENQVQKLTDMLASFDATLNTTRMRLEELNKKVGNMVYKVNEIAATTDIDMEEDVDRQNFE
jgi:archaellum component FlaC